MAKLTKARKAAYVNGGGRCCPYCESGRLDGGERQYEGGVVSQAVVCLDCGENWTDVYRLVDIKEA